MIKTVNTKFVWAAIHDYADAVAQFNNAVNNDAENVLFYREAVDTALDELACHLGQDSEIEE